MAKTSALAFWDETASRAYHAKKARLHLAVKGVLDGWNATDLKNALQAYAHEHGDDHELYFVSKIKARKLLDQAKADLAKDLSSSRLAEYAKFIGRLEEMYKRAIAAGNDRMALEVTRIEVELSNTLHGLSIGQDSIRQKTGTSSALDAAIGTLTKALAGRVGAGSGDDSPGTGVDETGPSLSPLAGTEIESPDMEL